jgi:hypothetical protein
MSYDLEVVFLVVAPPTVDDDRHFVTIANLQARLLTIIMTGAEALASSNIATKELYHLQCGGVESPGIVVYVCHCYYLCLKYMLVSIPPLVGASGGFSA